MRIVIVALRRLSANGICTQAVISEFVRRGHEIVWVCNRESESPTPQECVEFYEVEPRWVDAALARHPDDGLARKTVVAVNRMGMLRSVSSWPLVSHSYARRVSEAVNVACVDADVVVGTYTQIDALIAAHEAKLRYPRVRYIAWFLDSFTGGHGPRFLSSEQVEVRGKCWNRELLDNADAVVAMESSRAFHEGHCIDEPWYGKLKFLDLPLFDSGKAKDSDSPCANPELAKTIAYAGSFPAGIRSPKFFLDVISHLPNVPLRIIFAGDSSNTALNDAALHDSRIEVRGRIPHDEALELLRSADFVLSLGNRMSNMTPSKVFEYMALRKPIIATYPIDNEPSFPYLNRYGDVLLLDERGDSIAAAEELRTFLDAFHTPASSADLENMFWNNTPSAFCDFVESLGDTK